MQPPTQPNPQRPATGWSGVRTVRVAEARTMSHLLLASLALVCLACAGSPYGAGTSDVMRYRLAGSGTHWDVVGGDRVLEDIEPRYPDFFAVVLDPGRSDEPPTRRVRIHLEHHPVDRRNFDALNAVAIAYFELNYRGENSRSNGSIGFVSAGFRTAKLAAIPWRAYSEIQDPALRDAILDFFDDAGHGDKLGAQATSGRLARIVGSLAKKEADPKRKGRIEALASDLAQRSREAGG